MTTGRLLSVNVGRPREVEWQGKTVRTAIHLHVCPGCRADHDGVLEAARRFGDIEPEEPR